MSTKLDNGLASSLFKIKNGAKSCV